VEGDVRAATGMSLEDVQRVYPDLRQRGVAEGPEFDACFAHFRALIDQYIAHRAEREQQILKAMLDGARTVEEIVRRVYPALPASLSEAAADSVRAHLAKLRDDGRAS